MMMIDVDDDVMCQERGGEEAGNRMANGKKIKLWIGQKGYESYYDLFLSLL